jgi:glycosyltransferase involved in cell wall biosynthesis
MKALVVHHSLNSCGGGERVSLHIIRLLQEMGVETSLATTEKTDWDTVQRVTGVKLLKLPKEYPLFPFKLKAFGIYQRFLTSLHVSALKKKHDLTINTHGDVMALPCDITYLHFPVLAYWRKGILRPYSKYFKSLFWFAYFQPYRLIEEKMIEKSFSGSLILTNSNFSKDVIKEILGKDSIVVYPPCEVEEYIAKCGSVTDREDAAIYVARFSEEKNNHLLIHIAKHLPEVKFYLVGSLAGKGVDYYRYCKNLKDRLNVKNLEFYPNASHETKLNLISRCKVYVHLMPMEHFGISVVEALASGLIPVIHKSGGAWSDIIEFGKYGIGYEKLEPSHIAEKINIALEKWDHSWIHTAINQANNFSEEKFKERMTRILRKYYS